MSQFLLSSNTSTTPFDFRGQGTVSATGAFAGDVVTIEANMNGGPFYPLKDSNGVDGAFTEDGSLDVDHAKCKLRFTMTNSSGATITVEYENQSNQG